MNEEDIREMYPDDEARLTLVRALLEQEARLREDEPEFDLEKAIRASAPFRALILVGEPVLRALEYIEPERVSRRVEREVVDRIRRRNARPEAMGLQNGAKTARGADGFSDEEILRISDELKRGHRITLA